MPVKMKVAREGFNRFNLEELGLNITENPDDKHERNLCTYSDKSSSMHSNYDKDRTTIMVVVIEKGADHFQGIVKGDKVAILPMQMNYVRTMMHDIVESGVNDENFIAVHGLDDDSFDMVVKKISEDRIMLSPYSSLVDSWFRNAGDSRIPGAKVVDLSEISADTEREREVYIRTNTTLPFFNYLSKCLNLAIKV